MDSKICRKIVAKKLKSEDFTVLNYQQAPLEHISGYLGDHSTLEITINGHDEENHRFFVKSLPKSPPQRDLALEMKAFFKEERFYVNFQSELKNHSIRLLNTEIPTCFYASEEMIILEDLTLQGYQTLPSRSPLEMNCVKAALVTLAKLHSSGLILEEIKSSKLNEDFYEELGKTFYSDKNSVKGAIRSTRSGIEALIDLSHGGTTRISKNFFKERTFEGCDARKEFTKPSIKFRNTICHGDPWSNNFMFKIEESGVKSVIFDFQSYRYGPPAQDVMTFLHFTTERSFRESHLEECLRFYYEELDRNLDGFGCRDVVSKSEFFDSCQYFKQFALTQTVTRFQMIAMPDKEWSELLSNPEKSKSVLFDNKYDFIVKLCQNDRIFRKMNLEAITELRDYYQNVSL